MRLKKAIGSLAVVSAAAMLNACGTSSSGDCTVAPLADRGIDDLGLALPKPLALDISRIDAETVATHYEGPTRFLAAVLRGDYAEAQRYWDALAAITDPAERMREVYRLHFILYERGTYFLYAAQDWMRADPQSVPAQLLMGFSLNRAALNARGNQFSSKVSPAQMALFGQRFEKARPYLEAIAARKDVYAWFAHAELQLPYFYLGESERGWASIEYLIHQAPQYGWLYFWAAEYAKPKWAGGDGPARLRRLSDLAAQHRLNAADQAVLQQELIDVGIDMDNNPDPQAWRPYWRKRQAAAPHLFNLLQWLGHERQVENWPVVESLASQAIAINPHQAHAFHLRGLALKEMGRTSDALRDTVAAAVLGKDEAMSNLIHAHIRGGLGLKPGDIESMFAYCKMGAAFGLPSAANCVAAAHTEGFAGVARDDARAVAWHLLAARGGHSNSQHDLAVLLPKVKTGAPAQEAAQYWMREAARQGHAYAEKKVAAEKSPEDTASLKCRLAGYDWTKWVDLALKVLLR